jgi:hypothetical protein
MTTRQLAEGIGSHWSILISRGVVPWTCLRVGGPWMESTLIYPERKLWAAARDALIWLSGPVSERGATRGSRMALHMGGPMVHERRLAMREHPVGRRLIEERPDLCATLNDMAGLALLPEGSLGRGAAYPGLGAPRGPGDEQRGVD